MAEPITFRFIGSDLAGIAQSQNPGASQTYVLNGTLATPLDNTNMGIVVFPHFSRTVGVFGLANLSGTNYTITGTYRGQPQSQTIAGPPFGIIYTTSLFDTVTSVTTNNSPNGAASIATGTVGQTGWFNHNYHATVLGTSIQANVTGIITYTYEVTLDDIQTNPNPTVFHPIANLTGASSNQFGSILSPVRYSNIVITGSNGGGVTCTFLQQGIT